MSQATSPAAPTASGSDAGLEVRLRLSSARYARVTDLRATIVLTNRSPEPRHLFVMYLGAGNLTLEIQDAAGQRVPILSPPVPVKDDGVTGYATLGPGESQTFECTSGASVDVPPGHYRVRFQGVPADRTAGELHTGWVPFDIEAEAAAER